MQFTVLLSLTTFLATSSSKTAFGVREIFDPILISVRTPSFLFHEFLNCHCGADRVFSGTALLSIAALVKSPVR